jgi:hypothetical protein
MPDHLANDLIPYHRKLARYVRDKEALTRDNLVHFEKRGALFGLISSIYPLFSFTSFLRNYASKKGIVYKLWHPSTPYQDGEQVFLPNFRRFFGARIKDLLSGRSNRENLSIRQRNMGYAQNLLSHLDARLYHDHPMPISFAQDIHDQRQIKIARGELDSYYRLLTKLLRRLNETVTHKSPGELQRKSEYLDFLSVNTVPDDFVRGQYYGYENARHSEEPFSPQRILQELQRQDGVRRDAFSGNINRPTAPFNHPNSFHLIPLPSVARLSDKCMRMRLDMDRYRDYRIQGVDASTGILVGNRGQLLADGWYQFVILPDDHGQPVIRYYPCGDKREGIPFIEQDPQRSENAVDVDGYLIQRPQTHRLRYEKYIAHSELSGGVPVNAAGAFMLKEGVLRVIEDSSGHYARDERGPEANLALQFSHDVFRYYGVLTRDTILEHWTPYHGVDKLFKKAAGMFTQFYEPSSLKRRGISPQLAELRSTEPGRPSPIQVLRDLR